MPVFLHEVLAARARAHGDAPAFTVPGEATLTFQEWHERARACGAVLNVRSGDRVLLVFSDGDWYSFAALFAAVTGAGGTAVAVRHPVPPARLAEMARLVDAAGAVTGRGVPSVPGCAWTVPAADLPRAPGEAVQGGARPGWPAKTRPAPERPASILFTSGTTGKARAIVCPHADLMTTRRMRGDLLRPQENALLTSVAVGTNAAQTTLRDCLRNGVHTVVVNPFDPDAVGPLAEEHGVTAVSLIPTTARLAAEALGAAGRTLPRVRSVVCSSAPLDRTTVARLAGVFPRARIRNVYTMAEGGPSLVASCTPDRPPALGVIGPGVRVVDEDGRDVPAGQVGELRLRAGARRRSYVPDGSPPSGSGTRYLPGGWIATGDLCRVEDGGTVAFVARADDVIISGGRNIAATAVEAELRTHPAVLDAAVFGVPHESLGRLLVAAVVLSEDGALPQVREHAVRRLPAEQVPHDVVAVPEIPATAGGKPLKRVLGERYRAGPSGGNGPGTDLADAMEATVAAALGEVLNVPVLDADGNFFRLGGHSLLAVQVAQELSSRTDQDVPAAWVLRHPRVRDLAAALTRARAERVP
ncbi:AMP-binding protein [Actinomadura madurae]|uniref:AMP-binding protein n=1 Tax=Actinomadura madurae TaxID=1993 RepID=UPI0020262764|nr:AMP-binding protein [Actinomadura madurae]URN07338.1 AMP-binding protein [Actinomadura madurae]